MTKDERKIINDEIFAMICELIGIIPLPEQEFKISV